MRGKYPDTSAINLDPDVFTMSDFQDMLLSPFDGDGLDSTLSGSRLSICVPGDSLMLTFELTDDGRYYTGWSIERSEDGQALSVIGESIGSCGELAAFVTEATDAIAERIHTVAERRTDDVLDVGFYEVAALIDRCDDATLDMDELHRHPCVVSAGTRWRDTVTDDGYLIVVGEDAVTLAARDYAREWVTGTAPVYETHNLPEAIGVAHVYAGTAGSPYTLHDVRLTRRGLSMTTAEFAAAMGVDPRTVGRWETGHTPVPRDFQRRAEAVAEKVAALAAEYRKMYRAGGGKPLSLSSLAVAGDDAARGLRRAAAARARLAHGVRWDD